MSEKKIQLGDIINWTITILLIALIIWAILNRTYCSTTITITPQQAIDYLQTQGYTPNWTPEQIATTLANYTR